MEVGAYDSSGSAASNCPKPDARLNVIVSVIIVISIVITHVIVSVLSFCKQFTQP